MPAGGLVHNSDFRKLWLGQSISRIGSVVSLVALPLTALQVLGASPLQMGLLSAVEAASVLGFGLFAGAWADRLRRRPILIAADLGRAAFLALIPLLAALQRLSMRDLYMIATLTGSLSVHFDVSYQAYLPSLVGRENILEANSRLALTESIAEIAGPSLAGLLVQLVTAPMAIAVDAVSFVFSAVSLALIREREPRTVRSSQSHIGQEILQGLRAAHQNKLLRVLVLRTVVSSFFLGFGVSLYFLFVSRELNVPALWLGLLISVGGGCSLAGALMAERLIRRFGYGRALIWSALLPGFAMLLVPMAHGSLALCLVFLTAAQLGDLAWPVYNIADRSLRQSITPSHLLGRVNSALHIAYQGVMPLGALAGGALAQRFGVRSTLFLAAFGFLLATLWLFFSPLRNLRELPTDW